MSARDLALLELDSKRLPRWRGGELNPRATRSLSHPNLDPRDLALAENISIGVVKNLLLLQHLVAHYSNRSLKSIDPIVQKILAIALYQLRFLSRIPASAAVNEAVKQTQSTGMNRAAGFVNAVLRNATRQPNPPLPERSNPTEYARIVLSHPPEVFNRYEALIGTEKAFALCEHDNIASPSILRLAPSVTIEQLASDGVTFTPHQEKGMYVVEGARVARFAEWSNAGLAQLQDPTAAQVVNHLDLKPGQQIADRCAGLGTKTLQMHDMLNGNAHIVAIDASAPRIRLLESLLTQRQIQTIRPTHARMFADVRESFPETFDRILIDAPCSNSGVLARRHEARYHQDEKSLKSLQDLQLSILRDSAPRLSAGGKLIYSTCSIWPEENEHIVQQFLSERTDFKFLDSRFTFPSLEADPTRYHDGGFYALLERT